MDIRETIDDFLTALALEQGLAQNTCVAYGADLERFRTFLAESRTGLEAVDTATVSAFLEDERRRGESAATRARRTAALRAFFRYLADERRLKHDPTERMSRPKRDHALPRTLSERETFALIDMIGDTDPCDVRDRALLETLYGAGLRVSELIALRFDDIVADGELLRILGKGGKERLVPLGRAAGAAIERYRTGARDTFLKTGSDSPVIFLTRLGRPFTRQGVFKLIRERAAAAGIAPQRVSPHVLRHCYASHLLAHGADIRAIQELLGHADIGTTQVYTHVDRDRFAEIHRRHHPRA